MEPISNEQVKALIETHIPGAEVDIQGDGYKYSATVTSERFIGLNTVKRHKMVYAALNEQINSGLLHALTLKTLAPDEAP